MHLEQKDQKKTIQDAKNFKSRETDILICSYPKTGVHWLYEIVCMLVNQSTTLKKETKGQTTLEGVVDLSSIDNFPSPRVLNTHLSIPYIPSQHLQKKAKIVHMIRNPKDVCVSLYHHGRSDVVINLDVPWDEYFELWMNGKVIYGSWYDYELGYEKAETENSGLVYTIYFEEMKRDPHEQIQKLANFLEIPVKGELIEKIKQETSFENMQKNKTDNTKFVNMKGDDGFIYRKRKIGDWKSHFTEEQNKRFDLQFKDRMKESSYKIQFT